ncbi:SHOCT domain-containing protein [Halogeometricum limi]|uniref:Short C-terminal domain-containing protein n=1 Tax=Halogeometricum limi TaxID=555875 RepID=A0A1I6I9W7_9EURY|nr:SHOCT domain-containing protein [Halogeometricum limi]SFR63547.1 Short C-terminal domain-containing protein [Halogeometricum limi]
MSPRRSSLLARYTPDSRRWRRVVAALAAVGGPLAMYGAFAVSSGVKSGMVYNLIILVFGILAVTLPAVAATVLLAPDSGLARTNADSDSPLATLKGRYAAGEIDDAEFERRVDSLVELSETRSVGAPPPSASSASAASSASHSHRPSPRDRERESADN